MRSFVVGFVAGAALLQTQAALLAVAYLLVLLVGGLCSFLLLRRLRHPIRRTSLLVSAGVAIGFSWAGLVAQHFLSSELAKEWEGRDITIVGTIDSLPYSFEQGVRFNFAVERVVAVDADEAEGLPAIPHRLALSWYSAFSADEFQAVGKVQPGERWQLTVRLRRPHGNVNPFGFDYEVWLLEQGLRATGYVRPDQRSERKNAKLQDFVPGFGNAVERSRAWLRDRIYEALPGKEYAGVIVALVIGDQRAVSQSDWKVFNRTGVGHLMSISGLHITMISGLFAALVLALWRRSFFTRAELPLVLPAQKAAALAGASMALVYVLLAGFGVPAQRTLYMLSVVAAAIWFGRITNVSHVLCLALAVVVLLDPWAVLWPGFWLSFGAVAIILLASDGRVRARDDASTGGKWRSGLKAAAHTQYVVTVGLVPLTMLLFGQFSIVGPLANAVAIPVVSLLVTPLSLIGSVSPAPVAGWVLGAAHGLVEWLAYVLQWLSDSPAAVWSAPVPSWWMFGAALAGTLWLLAPAGWPVRWLGGIGLLPLFLHSPAHPGTGQMWVTAFDVGQGTALLVETENRRLLYDTGPAYSAESDGGNRVILPYLRARGIRQLDAMVVSHRDTDHTGGALSILDEIDVGSVYSSLAEGHPIIEKSAQHVRCEAGQAWTWDGAGFDMLHPSAESYESAKWKPNARSCTLRISLGGQAILIPGDIESPQEAELVDSVPERLRATVLVAPHHGSGTSSTPAFLNAVQPEIAVFQVGYRNRYHHPKTEIFERYGRLDIRRIRSDESGAVSLHFGASVEAEEFRRQQARYWYGR